LGESKFWFCSDYMNARILSMKMFWPKDYIFDRFLCL
jgi:hypothetical protein